MRLVLSGILTVGVLSAMVWQTSPSESSQPTPHPSVTPRWFKGNLHTHTLWSDGDDFPEMVADWYRRRDYQFVALSEHNVLAEGQSWVAIPAKSIRATALEKYLKRFGPSWVESRKNVLGITEVRLKPLAEFRSLLEQPGQFLLIPAEEITTNYIKRPVHLNAINLRDVIKPLVGDTVSETIRVNLRLAKEQAKKTSRRMLTFLNHPNFQWGVNLEEMLAVEELRFFEVYNGHPGVRNDGDAQRPSTERMWDILLTLRMGKLRLGPIYGLATDDSHNYHQMAVGQSNPGRGWVQVRAVHLTAESIVAALERGDFYGSTGVELSELVNGPEEIRLRIKPKPGVTYRTQFVGTMHGTPTDSKPAPIEGGSRLYHEGIGKVLAEQEGTEA
ncbi:MAG: hypothetical protein SNJ82_09505, partial [Gemmataceae bacterium]